MSATAVKIFFNFRSPYCYLVSRSLFSELANYEVEIDWRSLAGWDGRSPPERAKVKIPLTRQDVSRWCKRVGVPFNPPPMTTDPGPAALVACAAEEAGCLAEFVVAVMWVEWAEGQDIGQLEVLESIAANVGLADGEVARALASSQFADRLAANWRHAGELGVIGVPSFVVGEEIFWGNDRFDFLLEHLSELGLKKS